jgi:type IV pilus assembly protein PilV
MERSQQRGATLIEILITVVIMSIGLLGIAGIQALGIRANHTGSIRSQATMLAYDMADRVRANPGGAGNYHFPSALPTAEVLACKSSPGCGAADMANHDTYLWLQDLSASLPDGRGTVCLDSTPKDGDPSNFQCDGTGNKYVVKVWWDQNKTGALANYKFFYTEFFP